MNFIKIFPKNLLINLSTLWRVGFWGKMPGTNGSFLGLIFYTLLFHNLYIGEYVLICIITTYLACLICDVAEKFFNIKDPSFVILDEFVAMPVCFIGLQDSMLNKPIWPFMLTGFVLFRLFDIFKPFGIKKLQNLKGGCGIVIDDTAAAIATLIIMHIIF